MSEKKTKTNKYLKMLKRVKWKVAGPLLVAVVLVLYLIIALIVGLFTKIPAKKDININTNLCGLNAKKTLEVVQNENRENPVVVKDYNFYGESLNLFFDAYSLELGNSGSLANKTVVLADLCTGSEIKFDVATGEDGYFKLDNQIDLAKLTPGYYSVYVTNGETSSRVVYNSTLVYNNTFTTVTRDGKNLKVELIADKTLFDSTEPKEGEESVLDKNYLYIKVTEIEASENNEYDIAISVAPALTSTGVSVTGENVYGHQESEMLWPVAEEIVKKLEAEGFKVVLLKDAHDQEILYYGDGGTLNKAYDLKVKYMLHLDIYDYGGKGVEYSSYTNGDFARSVFAPIFEGGLFLQDESRYLTDCGLYTSDLTNMEYDGTYEIREAGGKPLGAGTYSESAAVNAKFAANNIRGINTLVVMPIDIRIEGEVNSFLNNYLSFADAVSKGVIDFLKR